MRAVRAVLQVLGGLAGVGFFAWLLSDLRSTAAPMTVPRTAPLRASPTTTRSTVPADGADVAAGYEAGASLRPVSLLLGAAGLGVLAWGGWLLLGLGSDQWISVGTWLAGGVLGHDVLLAPVVVALGVLAVHVAPASARTPLAVAFIVWGTLTLLTVPVLGRYGAIPDNPTLLDRPYLISWLLLSAAVAAAVVVAAFSRARRSTP